MNYSLTRETKSPSRGHKEDAGIDIYVPKLTDEYCKDFYLLNLNSSFFVDRPRNRIVINAHSRIKLPTGAYFNIPAGNMLLVLEKTSVPNKTGIISGARVIDASPLLNYDLFQQTTMVCLPIPQKPSSIQSLTIA